MEKIENRFIRYVKIDTEADENSSSYPSSAKQLDLAKLLHQELLDLGLESELDEWGLVYAKLPGDNSLPKIGLIAHMDTATTITKCRILPSRCWPTACSTFTLRGMPIGARATM